MCTLTIRRHKDNILVTMNRDEQRSREAERAPYQWDKTDIFAPQDTRAGGTWAAINKRGQIACLLNGYRAGDGKSPSKTRGEIIPIILSNDNPFQAAKSMDVKEYASFHLVLIEAHQTSLHSWDGKTYINDILSEQEWHFLTSSSWKQDEVKASRYDAFEEWRMSGAKFEGALPDIHGQSIAARPAHSVLMGREDACTKSITQFEITPKRQCLRYWSHPHITLDDHQEIDVI